MGLTRSEQWTLIAVVAVIVGGLLVQRYRAGEHESAVWVEAGDRWAPLSPEPGGRGGDGSSSPSEPSRPRAHDSSPDGRPPSRVSDLEGAALDLNAASGAELELLPGIGPAKAQAILDYRSVIQGFTSIEQLEEVKGIGPKTYEGLRPLVSVGLPRTAAETSGSKSASGSGNEARITGYTELKDEPVDINRASPEELQTLDGIGPVLAARIVEARTARPFSAPEELQRVRGIGPKTLAKIRDRITVR